MLHRIGFWWAVVITVTVLATSVGTAYALNRTLMQTGGNVIGIGFGGIGDLFGGVKEGIAAGHGGGGGPKRSVFPTNQDTHTAPVRARVGR